MTWQLARKLHDAAQVRQVELHAARAHRPDELTLGEVAAAEHDRRRVEGCHFVREREADPTCVESKVAQASATWLSGGFSQRQSMP